MPWVARSRSSARSAATVETGASWSTILLTTLDVGLGLGGRAAPGGAAGDDVVGRASDRRDQLSGRGVLDPELGRVLAQAEHHDAVRHGLDVRHVVADQDDPETGLAEPL